MKAQEPGQRRPGKARKTHRCNRKLDQIILAANREFSETLGYCHSKNMQNYVFKEQVTWDCSGKQKKTFFLEEIMESGH